MITILYIDDEPSLLEIGKRFLEMSGQFSVDTITSAPAALTLLNTKTYDAIISDYQMAEMDGIEFLKKIRSSGNIIPFILFTGKGREEVVIQALNEGVDFYLQKGGEAKSEFAELSHKIRQAVQQRKAEIHIKNLMRRESDIINFLPDATFAIDTQGVVIVWNRAMEKMTGISTGQILGKGDYEYALPFYHERRPLLVDLVLRDDPAIAEKYPDVIRDQNNLIAEVTISHINERKGVSLWFIASPLYDTRGKIIGAIESIREITNHKRAEEELLRKNEELHAAYEQLTAAEEELRQNYDELSKSQKELQLSEQRYRNVVEDQTEFISRFLPDGTHVFVNEAYCRYFGLNRNEIIGHRFGPKIPGEDQKRVKRFFAALSPDHPVNDIDHRIIMPDGSLRWQRWSDRAIFNSSGTVTEYQSVGRDITEQKQAEMALQDSYEQISATEEELRSQYDEIKEREQIILDNEQKLQGIVQGSPIPQFVIDKNHRVVSWNRALEEHSGVKADEVLGTTQAWKAFYEEERPVLSNLLVEDDTDKIKELYSGKFNRSKYVDGAYEVTDFFPRMGEHGTWLYFTAAALRDSHGNIIGAVETLEDINDRKKVEDELRAAYEQIAAAEEELRTQYDELKKSEDALREIKDRYQNVVEDQTELICRFKPDGTHVFVNEAYCRYFGKRREEIIGHKFRPVVPEEDGLQIKEMLATLTQENPTGFIRQRVVFSDGSIRWQRWVDRAIYDDAGNLIEYQSVGRDITDIIESEEALLQSNKKLNLLSSITRHDILNQLTGLKGYLELSKNFVNTPAKLSELINKEITAAEIIEEQIGFTRNYQDMGVNAARWQNVNTSISSAAATLPIGNVQVEIECTGYEVFADPLLEKVFYNLIENALRHGGKKLSTVRFSSHESDNGMIIVYENDGVRISQKLKEHLFERGVGKHTGLGLNLVREILSITGMTISDTTKHGTGVRFEITVPKGGYRFSAT